MEIATANPRVFPVLAAALLAVWFLVGGCGSGSPASGNPDRFSKASLTEIRVEILRSFDRSRRVDIDDLAFFHDDDAGVLHAYVDLLTAPGAIDFVPEAAQQFDALSPVARKEYLLLIAREVETRLSYRFGNVTAVLLVHFRDFRRQAAAPADARPAEIATYRHGALQDETDTK